MTITDQLKHCDGRDCKCWAFGSCECGCGCDWTPAEVYVLRDRIKRAKWCTLRVIRHSHMNEHEGKKIFDMRLTAMDTLKILDEK